jgi:hypothetical protein
MEKERNELSIFFTINRNGTGEFKLSYKKNIKEIIYE